MENCVQVLNAIPCHDSCLLYIALLCVTKSVTSQNVCRKVILSGIRVEKQYFSALITFRHDEKSYLLNRKLVKSTELQIMLQATDCKTRFFSTLRIYPTLRASLAEKIFNTLHEDLFIMSSILEKLQYLDSDAKK